MIGDLNWGDGSLVFCSEAKAPYIVIQTAPGERQRRSRRRMEPGCRSIVTAEERAVLACWQNSEWAERVQKMSTPPLQTPKRGEMLGVVKARKTVCPPFS